MSSTKHSAQSEWVITLDSNVKADKVRGELTKAGLQVDQMLAEIGVITGRGDSNLGPALRKVKGVADVTKQLPIDIGPPGSKLS